MTLPCTWFSAFSGLMIVGPMSPATTTLCTVTALDGLTLTSATAAK